MLSHVSVIQVVHRFFCLSSLRKIVIEKLVGRKRIVETFSWGIFTAHVYTTQNVFHSNNFC